MAAYGAASEEKAAYQRRINQHGISGMAHK